MQRRDFLRTSAGLAGAGLSAVAEGRAAPAKPRRPNIVLLMADDIGYECFGSYGSKQYHTPRLDALARQGMQFAHAYAQPLCTPTRVKLMTGLSNVRNYSAFSVLNRDQRTLGQYFKEAGYATAVAGKWQLLGAEHYKEQFRGKGTWPRDAGFDHGCLWQVDRLGGRYWEPLLWIDGENKQFGPQDYGPDLCTDYLCDFMAAHSTEPFLAYYPMILVHSPFEPTPDSASRNSKDRQKNFEDMVAYMDKLVGRLVDKVAELGLTEDTLFMFVGDNGTGKAIRSQLNGNDYPGGKGKTSESGIHVPLLVRQPGTVPAGTACDDLVDVSDFLPTLLEAVGAPIPEGLDGRSFLPQLHGKPGNPRQWLYCYYCPRPEKSTPTAFAFDKRWKLYDDGRFFDFTTDPNEKHPIPNDRLAGKPEAQAAHAKLAAALKSMPAQGQALLKFPTGR